MIKISHEVPFSMMEESLQFNDYDYALVHLLEENPIYLKFFKDSINKGREVILDNSLFELGEAFSNELFFKWVCKLNPTYHVVPDKFGDRSFTVDSVKEWNRLYKGQTNSLSVGVVQGSSFTELVECYKEIEPLVDVVAFSFQQKAFENIFPYLGVDNARAWGRLYLIDFLNENGFINYNKKHHLLGVSLPQEMKWYRGLRFITSVDTSSPIIHGLLGVEFGISGLKEKCKEKLADHINDKPGEGQKNLIYSNIKKFKEFTLR